MGGEWRYLTIAECAADEPYSTQIGPFGEKLKAHNYVPLGAPVLRGTNVNPEGRFHDDDFVFIDPAWAAAEFDKFLCEAGDVILCHKGTLGKIGIVPEKSKFARYVMGNSMLKVRCDRSKLEPLFLYYWLCSTEGQNYLFSRVSQVGVPQIQRPLSTLREARLPVPPLAEQRAIARILGALDDKIELNRKTNATLEAIARALFKSWFVDFDPVRAKAEGRSPTGMDAETAKLFPGEFVESELGPIPKGWRAASVGDCVALKRGTTYKGMLVGKPGPALLGLGSIRPGGGFRSDGFKTYGGECPPELMLRPGELYVSLKGATKDGEMIGSVARVPKTVPSGRLTQDTVKLEIQNGRLPRFLYRLLLTPEYRTYCANRAMGSAVVALSREDFLSYPLTLPDAAVLERFDTLLGSIEDRGEQNDAENVELTKTRDFLLPRLLSGELSVDAAEREVEAVA